MGCDTTRFLSVPVSRRDALRLGSGGALALVIGGGAGWLDRRDTTGTPGPGAASSTSPRPTTSTTTTSTTVPLVVPDVGEVDPAIVTIGRRVIEITGESDLGALLALLPEAEGDPLEAATERVGADFRAGETIVVDGWVLAASEARATAVIALLCDDTC
jgi:hypothetical protein